MQQRVAVRVGRLVAAAAVVASILVIGSAAPAQALPSCPQVDGWVGPTSSSVIGDETWGGTLDCTYTPAPSANLGAYTYANLVGRWVGPAENGPEGAMPGRGCGRDASSDAYRAISSDGTYSYVSYAIGGAGAEGEAILAASQAVFQQAVAVLLPALESIAKSCTASVEGTTTTTTPATDDGSSDRLAGATRYDTAVQVAQSAWGSADVVYVATGENFPDALGGGPAAAVEGAPILLVQRDSIPSATAAELGRLGPSRIVALGGTGAISDAVLAGLRSYAGAVDRVAGTNRYATAAAVSAYAFPGTQPVVYIASGRSFGDPIIAGAAAALDGAPLLLVDGQSPLESAVAMELARLAPVEIVLVGAPSDLVGVLGSLQALATVTQVADGDVYSRSAALWADVAPPVAEVVLATSSAFADALAGTPYAAISPVSYLMLSRPDCIPAPVAAQLSRLAPSGVLLLGGTAALSTAVGNLTSC